MSNLKLYLALSITMVIPTIVSAANEKAEKKYLPDCVSVELSGAGLSEEDSEFLFSIQKNLMTLEILRFATGNDSVLGDYYTKAKGKDFNVDVLTIREMARQHGIASLIRHDSDMTDAAYKSQILNHKWTKDSLEVSYCRVRSIGDTTTNAQNTYATNYLKYLNDRQASMHGQVGFFDVTVNDCTVSRAIITGNKFADRKEDPDFRYLVVNATFKNNDKEGRLPLEGSLIITKDGQEYKYDTTERITHESYGIGLQSLNPLIKLKTKIAYKVPNELDGEVYWQPGRNVNDKRLWCTYLPATS
ncbi:hypothetical protein [Pseudomonas sp. 008]|uniref:hypothetical protein n=1 Tax=Pseudomonas sp. 008 TaxID=2803906 RepID=UPI0019508259|nr:hypothetical protein [Pseudomonas sp. 008]GID03222.1 hypothetical protein TMM008_04240 [Pseudomonas sp. 008]